MDLKTLVLTSKKTTSFRVSCSTFTRLVFDKMHNVDVTDVDRRRVRTCDDVVLLADGVISGDAGTQHCTQLVVCALVLREVVCGPGVYTYTALHVGALLLVDTVD